MLESEIKKLTQAITELNANLSALILPPVELPPVETVATVEEVETVVTVSRDEVRDFLRDLCKESPEKRKAVKESLSSFQAKKLDDLQDDEIEAFFTKVKAV
jgi:hypothetical protein